jgi:hypothetical protein
MTVVVPYRVGSKAAIVIAVACVLVAGTIVFEMIDVASPPPAPVGPAEHTGDDDPLSSATSHIPTAEEIAAAEEFWQQDVDVAKGRDVVRIEYEYRPDVNLNFPQAIIVRWARCQSSDGIHRDGDNDETIATGSLDPKLWDIAAFVEMPVGDRNRNGIPDVALRTDVDASGFSRERVHLFEPVGDRLIDVLDVPWLGEARWPVRFEDVDHDRVDELVTIDRTWESTSAAAADDDHRAPYSHESRPHAEFVVAFERGGRMMEDGRSLHLATQLAELERQVQLATRSARDAPPSAKVEADKDNTTFGEDDVDVRLLTAAGSLLILELARPEHDADDAARRFRSRVAALHIDSVHSADVAWIERHALAVNAERPRPPH